MNIKEMNSKRKDAEQRDDERKNRIWKAVENLKKIEELEKIDDKERKEFIKNLIAKTTAAQEKTYEEENER